MERLFQISLESLFVVLYIANLSVHTEKVFQIKNKQMKMIGCLIIHEHFSILLKQEIY